MIHFALFLLAVPTGGDARFHPAKADIYVEVPDVKAMCTAYAEAPLMKTLHDPSVARVGEAAKAMGADLGAMFSALLPTPDPSRPDDRCWPWSALTSASMSLVGLDTPAPANTPWGERASGWIVLDFVDAAAATQAMSAIGASAGVLQPDAPVTSTDGWVIDPDSAKTAPDHADGKSASGSSAPGASKTNSTASKDAGLKLDATLSIDGADAVVVRHELDLFGNKVAFWIAQSGTRIVGGIGRAQPQDLVERLAKPDTSFVAQHAVLAEDKGLQAPCGVVIARAWSDLESLPVPDMASDALGSELVDLAMAELVPFVGQRGVHRLQLCKDQFMWESLVERVGPSRALDDLYGAAPIPASTAGFVPKEAIGAWLLSIQPAHIEALMERVLAHVTTPSTNAATDTAAGKTTPPGSSTGATSDATNGAASAHPSAALGNSAAIFQLPIQPNMSTGGITPNTQIAIELKDATAFQSAFEAWIAHVRSLDPTLKVEDKPYHKRSMYTFTHGAGASGDEKGGGSTLHPTLVILPDRVVIATSRQYAQSEVRRIEAGGDATNALMREGAIPTNAFEVSWMDWGTTVGKLYDLAKAVAPLALQGSGKSFDASKLPTSAELFHYIQPSTSNTTRVDGKLYKRSVTSLGPETPLAFVALAVGFTVQAHRTASMIAASAAVLPGAQTTDNGAIQTGHVVRSTDESGTVTAHAKDAERTATLSALRDVKTGLAVYRSQFGRVPDTLDDLLKGTDAFPNGFLEGGAVPKDGWKHALVYATQDKGATYDLHSCGANGVDDHGGSDDVRAP